MALKLIFMGTPDFAVPILESIQRSNHNILSVYTQSPKKSNRGQRINYTPVHEFSNKERIEVRCPQELNDLELEYIKRLNPDVIVVAAYGKILPEKFGSKNFSKVGSQNYRKVKSIFLLCFPSKMFLF